MSPRDISELIDQIYAVVEATATWEDFLTELSRVIPHDVAVVQLFDLRQRAADLQATKGWDSAVVLEYEHHYAQLNPWMRIPNALPEGAVRVSDEALPIEEFRKTAFYHEFGKGNCVVHSMGCGLSNAENRVGYLSLNRSQKTGPFSQQEIESAGLLVPHIRRALRFAGRLEALQAAAAVRGALAPAYIRVDERMRIREASPRAEELLQLGGTLSAREGRLMVAPKHRDNIEALVAGRLHAATLRDADAKPLPVKAIPLRRGRQTILLLGLDHAGSCTRRLETDFGLTPAELRLTRTLLECESLTKAAERLRISINTAKTQLRSIFNRTGTRNQKELAKLVTALTML